MWPDNSSFKVQPLMDARIIDTFRTVVSSSCPTAILAIGTRHLKLLLLAEDLMR